MDTQRDFTLNAASLECALNKISPMNSRERHKALERVAVNCPAAIVRKVEELTATIRLLREYVPEAADT